VAHVTVVLSVLLPERGDVEGCDAEGERVGVCALAVGKHRDGQAVVEEAYV
jgi:hypothetical protein